MTINKEETTMEIRITDNSPEVDLAPGHDFAQRAAAWLRDAGEMVSSAIEWSDAEFGGQRSEEMELLFTNRQADHLAIGLKLLGEHFNGASA